MKVKISELKAKLSAYLNAVRQGQTVTVLDRRTPVALVVPVEQGARGLRIEPAASPPRAIGEVRGVRPSRTIDVVSVLSETRGET